VAALYWHFYIDRQQGNFTFFCLLDDHCIYFHDTEKKRVTRTIKLICQSYFILISIGVIIGLLSGIAGIGGGFLIIPALVLVGKLPMRKAVATSLFIISLKSLIGFTGDLSALEINWAFLLIFTLISFLGIFIGVYLSTYIEGENLKKSFGWMVLIMAIGILYKEVFIQH